MKGFSENLLKDKVIIVTGGRSGIGFEIAKQMLTLGAKVVISSRKEDKLKAAAQELSNFGECYCKAVDIRQGEQVDALMEYVKGTHGRLDILVNNAGGQFPASAEKISDNGWSSVVNNNLNGTFFMSKRAANIFFIPQKRGVIVNITASVLRGFPAMAHTGAARAGVENLTKTLAVEWGEHNIRVNSIAPGVIKSEGLSNYPVEVETAIYAKVAEETPLNRLGEVSDVANACVFVASDLASYLTGTTISLNGGNGLSGDMMGLLHLVRTIGN